MVGGGGRKKKVKPAADLVDLTTGDNEDDDDGKPHSSACMPSSSFALPSSASKKCKPPKPPKRIKTKHQFNKCRECIYAWILNNPGSGCWVPRPSYQLHHEQCKHYCCVFTKQELKAFELADLNEAKAASLSVKAIKASFHIHFLSCRVCQFLFSPSISSFFFPMPQRSSSSIDMDQDTEDDEDDK